jgi:hypothetical protein
MQYVQLIVRVCPTLRRDHTCCDWGSTPQLARPHGPAPGPDRECDRIEGPKRKSSRHPSVPISADLPPLTVSATGENERGRRKRPPHVPYSESGWLAHTLARKHHIRFFGYSRRPILKRYRGISRKQTGMVRSCRMSTAREMRRTGSSGMGALPAIADKEN